MQIRITFKYFGNTECAEFQCTILMKINLEVHYNECMGSD